MQNKVLETEKPGTADTVNGLSDNKCSDQAIVENNNVILLNGQENTKHLQIKNRLDGFRYLADEMKLPLILMKGKEPIGKKWQLHGYRPFEEIRFNNTHNSGILTGRVSGLIGLDIDDEKLFKENIPETFTVKTGKGYHHYFQLPDDGEHYSNRSIKTQGFDIKAEGGVLVAPFSIHPETRIRYEIVNYTEFAEAPEWLFELSLKENKETINNALKQFSSMDIEAPDDELISAYEKLLSKPSPKGHRSDRIWFVLHEFVENGLSNAEIIGLFEMFPKGIGAKYIEKGGSRVNWLLEQIQQVREKLDSRKVSPFLASNQAWVKALHKDILDTFTDEYGLSICDKQSQAIEDACNLFIGLLNNENSDWYCLPFPVGTGKTETIKHLIKFLDRHDTVRKYSIALSLEKITEIDEVHDWLIQHGVSEDYFQIVHHKVENLADVFEKLKKTPVIIHTHYKLKGATYLSDYFKYKGEDRTLLLFDESMLNSMTSADRSQKVAGHLGRFIREYNTNPRLAEEIPENIFTYFKKIHDDTNQKETRLNSEEEIKRLDITIPAEHLLNYDYPDLIRFSSIIENFIANRDKEEISTFRDLLTIGKSPEELRQIFIQKENGQPILFTMKEVMSSTIRNLVTTDASREIRTLFNFSEKQVKILDVELFRTYEGLNIYGLELPGGKEKVSKAFFDKNKPNPYLIMVEEIIKEEKDNHENFLIFHSKQLGDISDKIVLRLIMKNILTKDEAERMKFMTFGRENATNDFKDCGCIIFLGLHYKPTYAYRAHLIGEMKGDKDVEPWMIDKVEEGEIALQLHQGSGRGKIRKGNMESQSVYYCAYDPTVFFRGLRKAFPGATVQTYNFEALDRWKEKYDKRNQIKKAA